MVLSILALLPSKCIIEYQDFVRDTEDIGSPFHSPENLYMSAPNFNYSAASTPAVDIGRQAQMDNGYPLEPVSDVLPKRVFMIYGLESSGTTFVAKTISKAVGIQMGWSRGRERMETRDYQTEVHHISLPMGAVLKNSWGYETRFSEPLPMAPVYYPSACAMQPLEGPHQPPPAQKPPPEICLDFMGNLVMTPPHRFFVNMTSNIQWYRERGVHVYPIMVVRDPMLHFQGILKKEGGHVSDASAAYQEYEQGRTIVMETIERGLNPIIVSYEALMTLRGPYLRQLCHQLGISSDYNPSFQNGNTKYVSTNGGELSKVEQALLKEDAPDAAFMRGNSYRPPNPLEFRDKIAEVGSTKPEQVPFKELTFTNKRTFARRNVERFRKTLQQQQREKSV